MASQLVTEARIHIAGDGNVIGDNNINIVIKEELAQVLRNILERGRSLFQLPAPLADFVGRQNEIKQLEMVLGAHGSEVICISGMGGIGKTELTLQVATLLRERFPDGQLTIDMRGTTTTAREPAEVMAQCVRAVRGLEGKLPDNIDELSNLYRSLLSDKRMLLFLDNVADAAQVAPLRPPPGCSMVVTSRTPIALPGIKNIFVEEFSPTEARELLSSIATGVNSAVADEICELCGYLPLAIRAAGSLLAVTVDLIPSSFANELRDERTRLEKLGTEGVDISVRASFNLSYARLSEESAAVFRQLAVFSTSFDSQAEEIICRDENHQQLSDLVRRSLVLFDKKNKRYRLHELVRIFGRSLTTNEEIFNSEKRFAQHYLNVLTQANQLYLQSGPIHSQGLEIFNRESENIRRGWGWSSNDAERADDVAEICWSYTTRGGNILLNRLPPNELKVWCRRSISIAEQFNNREAELNPLTLLGLIHQSVGEYNSAEQVFSEAIDLANSLDDQNGVAIAYQHLGRALADSGKLYDAIQCYERAKQIWCDLGKHENEVRLIADIGLAYSGLRETNLAVERLQWVIDNARKEGNQFEEANGLANLANVYGKSSRSQAISLSEQAAQLFQKLGYKHWAAQALSTSGLWLAEIGETDKGIQRIEQSIGILQEIGDRHREVLAAGQLGEAYMELNEPQKAIAAFDRQLQLAREVGDRHREANALGDKGIMLVAAGEIDLAILSFDEARNVAQLTGNLNHEFNTLCKAGEAYVKAGRRDEAIKTFKDQVRIGGLMGIVSKQLHALKHLADSFAEWKDLARAKAYMQTRVIVSQKSKDMHDYPDALFESATFFAGIGQFHAAILQAEFASEAFLRNNDTSCAMKVCNQIDEWKRAQTQSQLQVPDMKIDQLCTDPQNSPS